MSYYVDPTGKPINIKVAKATKPEFGQAALAVLEVARYSPALNEKTGKPEKSTEQKMTIPFDKGRIDTEALGMLAKPDGVLFAVADLDAKSLAPIGTVPRAIFPEKQAGKKVASGTAQIEVVVDKNGVVRAPRIVAASEPEFGWSAATAALGYQFPKPVKGGKPVAVKLVIPFTFNLAEANAAAASATSAAPALPATPVKK
jgi:TonB family protein